MEQTQKIGFIGLGKMGLNMVENLVDKKIPVVAYNRSPRSVNEAESYGAIPAFTIEELFANLRDTSTKIIWLMVPAGDAVDKVLFGEEGILKHLNKGDIVIDGGNSFYKDSKRRCESLQQSGVEYIDCGTSGGIEGARHGACLMIGAKPDIFVKTEWIFKALAIENGYAYIGLNGSGHYVKMIHNAIEYGMMQSIAEGLELIKEGAYENIDLKNVLNVWNHGSIVESYLTKITQAQLEKDPELEDVAPYIADNGEGAWSIITALAYNKPFLSATHALFARYQSRETNSLAFRLIAAMRNGFGGHEIKKPGEAN